MPVEVMPWAIRNAFKCDLLLFKYIIYMEKSYWSIDYFNILLIKESCNLIGRDGKPNRIHRKWKPHFFCHKYLSECKNLFSSGDNFDQRILLFDLLRQNINTWFALSHIPMLKSKIIIIYQFVQEILLIKDSWNLVGWKGFSHHTYPKWESQLVPI